MHHHGCPNRNTKVQHLPLAHGMHAKYFSYHHPTIPSFILVNESCNRQSTCKERFGGTIPNLIRTYIAHPLTCLVMPQTNLITSDRALRSLKFHINSISNTQAIRNNTY